MNTIMLNSIGVVKADVLKALEIMGYGVLAIFIVIAILIILVQLMHVIEKKSEQRKSAEGYKSFADKTKEKWEDFKERHKKEKKNEESTPSDENQQ